MEYSAAFIIRIIAAAVLAIIFGNGSVVAFNRLKPDWFLDYEEADCHGYEEADCHGGVLQDQGDHRRDGKVIPVKLTEADEAGRQRLPSTPWKYAFTAYFALCGLYLAIRGGSLAFEISVLCVLFVVLEMAIADQLYQVVPDQFSIMLALMSAAFIGYHEKWWEPAAGAVLGLAVSLAILGLGFILFRTGSIGGADIKFFTCMGLITGRTGIAVIYILTTLFFAAYSAVRIAAFGGSVRDKNAMLPAACAAVTVYFLLLWNTGDLFILEL